MYVYIIYICIYIYIYHVQAREVHTCSLTPHSSLNGQRLLSVPRPLATACVLRSRPSDLGGARLRASGFGFRDEGLGWVKMGLGFRVTVVGFRGLRLTG